MILLKDTANHVAFLPRSSEASWMPAAGGQAGKHFYCISCSLGQLTPLLPGLPELSRHVLQR